MILMGLWVAAMWIVGAMMAVLYVYAVTKGRELDLEKDAIDAEHYARGG